MDGRNRSFAVLIFLAVLFSIMAWPTTDISHAASKKVKPRTVMVLGVLAKEDSGYIIRSGRTKYAVTGQDLDRYVGKKIKATGISVGSERGRVIEVSKIQEFKRKK